MKITLFSSNQRRHLHLAKQLGKLSEELFFISEVNTIFPGTINDFYSNSPVMKKYFVNVINSEKKFFSEVEFLPSNIKTLSIKSGDLSYLTRSQLIQALNSDIYIVFGASYIKGWLIDFLTTQNAINVHMGTSPYYRGSSCNFWALFDYKPGYVGSTIHRLSKGLDNGDILFHCMPKYNENFSSFDFTMSSVRSAHNGLVSNILNKKIFEMLPIKQNKSLEIRYSKNNDFNDDIAKEFLERDYWVSEYEIKYPELINPEFI